MLIHSIRCNFLLSIDSESDAMELQSSDFQRNPAYIHFSPTESSPADLLSGNYKNPAYNIDAQPVIPSESDTDRTPQGAQNVNCSQNPVYIHLGVHIEETIQAATAATSPCDYSQNPAYGIHSNPN